MYRVVLIDEKKENLEELQHIINWSDYDCEVVGTAADVWEGADVLRRLRPHILFMDIRIPGGGLALLAGLRDEFPDMQVTVLTECREFSSAREAIRLDVHRYLLKPAQKEEVREALQTMEVKLDTIPRELRRNGEMQNAGTFIVDKAMRFMRENYAKKLSLQTVADSCYVSQWHLSKLLNRYAQRSFYEVLNAIRIQEAKKLLEDPGLKIGQISEMVGYADTAHFARTFKKLENMSANEYRNSLRR